MSRSRRRAVRGTAGPVAGDRLRLRTRVLLVVVILLANIGGSAVVVTLAVWILPLDGTSGYPHLLLLNMLIVAGYVPLALGLGVLIGHRLVSTRRGRGDPGRRLRTVVLGASQRLGLVQAGFWSVAAVAFFTVNVWFSWQVALQVLATVVLGGVVTVAIAYRLVERVLRPEVARVFAGRSVPRRRGLPGVVARALGGWLFGTAAPLVGVMIAAATALMFGNYDLTRLSVVVLVLCGIALFFGGTVIVLTAVSISAPVLAVRRAMGDVERGAFDVDVDVFDTTELGQLQAGFNQMAAGLRERERVRVLFGRQVGEDVARLAVESGLDGQGALAEVAVLFVDLIGSTALAATHPPQQVVDLINQFLGVVIDVVEDHGGWINKFQGDAALAVFGAPSAVDDAAGQALGAARVMGARLTELFDADLGLDAQSLGAGIGVSFGSVVAGRIGDHRRYEYTVIGDPVNEAARLCEVAKELRAGSVGVTASAAALDAASARRRRGWQLAEHRVLRGRIQPTGIAVPDDGGAATPVDLPVA